MTAAADLRKPADDAESAMGNIIATLETMDKSIRALTETLRITLDRLDLIEADLRKRPSKPRRRWLP